MNNIRAKAFELRKQKKSYNIINQQLGVPKSTLSYWFKNDRQSSHIKEILVKRAQKKAVKKLRLMALANKEKWRKIRLTYREAAIREFPKLVSKPLFGPGLAIYWGEGDKRIKNSIVRISNIDPRLLRVFITFLRNVCQVQSEKIRLWLLLYPDLKEEKCKTYWGKVLGVSQKQFIKSQYIFGREKKRRLDYGVCSVQVYSRELKEKIIEWINLYSIKLTHAGMV